MEPVSLRRTLPADGGGGSRVVVAAAATAAKVAAAPWFVENRYDPGKQADYLLRLANLRQDLIKQQEEQLLNSVQRFYSQESGPTVASRLKPKSRARRGRICPGPENHKRLQMEKTRRLEAKRFSSNMNVMIASLEGKSVCGVPALQEEPPVVGEMNSPRSQDIINAQQAHISQLISAAKFTHLPSTRAKDTSHAPRQVLLTRRHSVDEMKPVKTVLKTKRWAREPSVITKTQPHDLLPDISRLDMSHDHSRDVSREQIYVLDEARELVQNKCEAYVRGPCTTPVAWVHEPNQGRTSPKQRRGRARSKTTPSVKPLHKRPTVPSHPLKFIYVQPNAGKPLAPPGASKLHRRHSLSQITPKGDPSRESLASRSSCHSRSADSPLGNAQWSLNVEIPFGGTVPLDRVSSNIFKASTDAGSVSSRRNSRDAHSPIKDDLRSLSRHSHSIVLSEADQVIEDTHAGRSGTLCRTYKQNELRHREMSKLLEDIKELNQITQQMEQSVNLENNVTTEGD